MSSIENPVFLRSALTVGMGASITSSGLVPPAPQATTLASGLSLIFFAASSLVTTSALAPSLSWDEFPAVRIPSGANAGLNFDSFSMVVSARMHSSSANASLRPSRSTSTGTISSLNLPALWAFAAFMWLSYAYSSACFLVTPYFFAMRSPVMPIWNSL